jgi:hypothetical protein
MLSYPRSYDTQYKAYDTSSPSVTKFVHATTRSFQMGIPENFDCLVITIWGAIVAAIVW